MNNQVACRYAVVQFTPYIETAEFANVGVVMACPQTGFFGFKLQTRKHKRVTDFFDELPKAFYLRAIQGMKSELERVGKIIDAAPVAGRVDLLRAAFDELLHPREAIVRFSKARFVLTDDPSRELGEKFDHYVDRSFATQEFVEQEIEKRIRALLGTLDLARPFRPLVVGDEDVHVRFPLVQQRGVVPIKIIKPFNLTQADPMGIYDHGGNWLQRLQRLKKRSLLPHDVLFAVRGPAVSDAKRYAAYQDICADLRQEGVETVEDSAQERIEAFASA